VPLDTLPYAIDDVGPLVAEHGRQPSGEIIAALRISGKIVRITPVEDGVRARCG
jgi:hypothetical protein